MARTTSVATKKSKARVTRRKRISLAQALFVGRYSRPLLFVLAFVAIGAGSLYFASAATTTYNLWGNSIPKTLSSGDSNGAELGVRFRSSVAGYATGVRFYKSAQNTGIHTGDLWDSQGRLLATVQFANETSSGWQTAMFATPVSVASGANYIVSYHAPNGNYSLTHNFLNRSRGHKNLTAPKNTATTPNGIFVTTTTPKVFPTQSGNGDNYWVDVVFNTKLISPQPAPAAPTSVIASAQADGSVVVSWQASVSTSTITGYTLYRDGAKYASLGNVTTYTDTNTQPGTTYSYQVQATDGTGQTSALSAKATVTTASSSSGGGTTTPPPPTGGGSTGCATSTPHVPDGPDGMGGCWPGPSNTGPNAAESTMSTYTGPCSISAANTVIDSKVINCGVLYIAPGATNVVVKNSYIHGGVISLDENRTSSFTVQDSFLDNGLQYPACSNGTCAAGKYACGSPVNQTTECGVGYNNFTILRTEIINSNRAAYCEYSCTLQDNYFHGTNLWPDKSNLAHASSVRNEQYLTLKHNAVGCDYTGPFVNSEIGCSADMSGYADFAPIMHDTIDSNLFLSNNVGQAYCTYGGGTAGKPYSGSANNATYIVFSNNVFQRGANGKCGEYGPVTDFITGRTGNVWTNNKFDNGTVVDPS